MQTQKFLQVHQWLKSSECMRWYIRQSISVQIPEAKKLQRLNNSEEGMMVIQSEVRNKRSIIKVLIFQGEANFHLEEFVLSCMKLTTITWKISIIIDMLFIESSTIRQTKESDARKLIIKAWNNQRREPSFMLFINHMYCKFLNWGPF